MFFEDDNLLILMLIALVVCSTMDAEIILMYVGVALDLLNGL